jgi:hypothetical protein
MKHPTHEELSAYLERDLPKDRCDGIEKHLDTCQECRESLAFLRHLVTTLEDLPCVQAPAGLAGRVMRRIEHREGLFTQLWRMATLSWLPMPGRLIGAVSAAVLVVALFAALPPGDRGRNLKLREVERRAGKTLTLVGDSAERGIIGSGEGSYSDTMKMGKTGDAKGPGLAATNSGTSPSVKDMPQIDLGLAALSSGGRGGGINETISGEAVKKSGDRSSDRKEETVSDRLPDLAGIEADKVLQRPVGSPKAEIAVGGNVLVLSKDLGGATTSSVDMNGNALSVNRPGMPPMKIGAVSATGEIRLVMRSENPELLAERVSKLALQQGWKPVALSGKPSTKAISRAAGVRSEQSNRAVSLSVAEESKAKSDYGYRSGVPASLHFMIPVKQRPTVVSLLRKVGPVEVPPAASGEGRYETMARGEAGSMGYSTTEPSAADGDKGEVAEKIAAAGVVESGQKGIALRTTGDEVGFGAASVGSRQEEVLLDSTLIAGSTQESESLGYSAFFGVQKDFDSSQWIILTVLLPKVEGPR